MYKELDSARNSFAFIIEKYRIKRIHIPYYLCDVMRHTAFSAGCKPVFYHIDDDFMPKNSFSIEDYILYPNYFGVCDDNVNILVNEYPNIIVDNAHSYYSSPLGFACFNSRKKFLEVSSGSDLWCENYEDNRSLNINMIKNRQYAFRELDNMYGKDNLLNIKNSYSPFVYPYLAETEKEADIIVSNLTKSGKVVYRYWNELPKNYSEYKFYSRLVPVPIF